MLLTCHALQTSDYANEAHRNEREGVTWRDWLTYPACAVKAAIFILNLNCSISSGAMPGTFHSTFRITRGGEL